MADIFGFLSTIMFSISSTFSFLLLFLTAFFWIYLIFTINFLLYLLANSLVIFSGSLRLHHAKLTNQTIRLARKTFFIFTINVIDLDILSISAISHVI